MVLVMYYWMYLIMDGTTSTVWCDTSPKYQQFLPPVSEQKLCERVYQCAAAPMPTTDVWRGITYC